MYLNDIFTIAAKPDRAPLCRFRAAFDRNGLADPAASSMAPPSTEAKLLDVAHRFPASERNGI
jgi:hypothetical protein